MERCTRRAAHGEHRAPAWGQLGAVANERRRALSPQTCSTSGSAEHLAGVEPESVGSSARPGRRALATVFAGLDALGRPSSGAVSEETFVRGNDTERQICRPFAFRIWVSSFPETGTDDAQIRRGNDDAQIREQTPIARYVRAPCSKRASFWRDVRGGWLGHEVDSVRLLRSLGRALSVLTFERLRTGQCARQSRSSLGVRGLHVVGAG
jgi:hypothetical protein